MERNELTIAINLKPGDRFYKRGDKAKKVYEIVQSQKPGKSKHNPYQVDKTLLCCEAATLDMNVHGSVKEQYFKTILNDVEVIYLRSRE